MSAGETIERAALDWLIGGLGFLSIAIAAGVAAFAYWLARIGEPIVARLMLSSALLCALGAGALWAARFW